MTLQDPFMRMKRDFPNKNVLEFLEQTKPNLFNDYARVDIRGILEEIDERRDKLPTTKEQLHNLSEVEIRANIREVELIQNAQKLIKQYEETRTKTLESIANGTANVTLIEEAPTDTRYQRTDKKMTENTEIRAFQKFITEGTRSLTEIEARSLNTTGAAAVIPTEIYQKLITSEKYSDLLRMATVFNAQHAGKMQIPVASDTAATWRTELAAGAEAEPTLTKLDLGVGFELMRLTQISAAAAASSAQEFTSLMLELLGSETIGTLEAAFVSGGGVTEPKGLDNLTWNAGNQVLTASAITPITAKDIADAMGKMSQKYLRNSVIICNVGMQFKIAQFLGTSEYIFNAADGASRFMGRPILVNENVADDTVYIVDPSQLYVRFSQPLTIEADRSAGFTSASIYLRSLCVVDAVWNPKAAVRVGLGA